MSDEGPINNYNSFKQEFIVTKNELIVKELTRKIKMPNSKKF